MRVDSERRAEAGSGHWATAMGLAVGWGGTALLVSPAARMLGDPRGTVVAIVVFWERPAPQVIVEETIFRGFTVTRLARMTGRVWLAAALTLAGFSLLHVPVWGWGFALAALVSGILPMAFFVWRRDLLAMIVAHAATDLMGLAIAPLHSEWWTEV